MTPEIFPEQSDFFHKAAESVAGDLGCTVDLVYTCMGKLDAVYNQPEHLDAVSEVTHHFNDAAKFARRLHWELTLLTPSQRKDLEVAGCVTVFQLEHLADVLNQDAKGLSSWSRKRIRTGGRNLAAYDVSELIRRIFRRQRRAITFGTSGETDNPSTAFGRAVCRALGHFGVKAGWRRPAMEAFDKQRRIQERMRRICEARQARGLNTK